MSLLSELNTIISPLVPLETGVFSDPAPDKYAVITPMVDTFELWKSEVNEDDVSVPASVITGWYTQVYEPVFTVTP